MRKDIFGGLSGYSSVNSRSSVATRSSHSVSSGPTMTACHFMMLLSTGSSLSMMPSCSSVRMRFTSFMRRRRAFVDMTRPRRKSNQPSVQLRARPRNCANHGAQRRLTRKRAAVGRPPAAAVPTPTAPRSPTLHIPMGNSPHPEGTAATQRSWTRGVEREHGDVPQRKSKTSRAAGYLPEG